MDEYLVGFLILAAFVFFSLSIGLWVEEHKMHEWPTVQIENVQEHDCSKSKNTPLECTYDLTYHYNGVQNGVQYQYGMRVKRVKNPMKHFNDGERVVDPENPTKVVYRSGYLGFYIMLGLGALMVFILAYVKWGKLLGKVIKKDKQSLDSKE